MEKTALNHKLVEACSGLGINLLDAAKYVRISDLPQIACWGHDESTGEYYIFVNPKILRFPVELIQIVLRHELLHHAGYNDMRGATDRDLYNVCLDIAVNRILTLAYEKQMKAICRRMYPQESINTILTLGRPDINPEQIEDENLKCLWKEIWENPQVPSPSSLYYRLLFMKGDRGQKLNPFSGRKDKEIIFRMKPVEDKEGKDKFETLAKGTIKGMLDKVMERSAFSRELSKVFRKILVGKEGVDIDGVSNFIRRLDTRQQLDATASRIINSLNGRPQNQLYPYRLSKLGLVYVACGITKILPLYHNLVPEGRKPRLGIYIDTSPSMDEYKKMEVFLVDKLKEDFPTTIYAFSGSVQEITTKEFAEGDYPSGYSTSFDSVVEHLCDNTYDAGVVFTDGESGIYEKNKNKFKASHKKLFTVYFTNDGDKPTSDLDEISIESMAIRNSACSA
ncbi:hypothetical protein COS91_06600 [Candidatus Desantisbacteria bacterium CG07_land_8_20_14_0_80_39_15]|uniref:Metallopeptidase domain-containing protein n=1 Tax=Candidatus Desantisbacteria bacterium CG07_land_8_20_14_0_80_39_15 TaxID=1974549 RepID=A0A2M6ZF87_9BACT|nr:MAG: hypothetical protein COS91_06600 [Candidatus Desantisbacteria bacterium CG07_land_8_20_14_0_80_39_15]